MAADYNGSQGLEVRLSWPEDTGEEGAARAPAPRRSPVSASSPSDSVVVPGGDAEMAPTGPALSRVERRLVELMDRVAALEEGIQEGLGHIDDRLEYLAGAGMMPDPHDGGGEALGARLELLSGQLENLAEEVTALRRRIALRGKGDPAVDQHSREELAHAVADLVVATLGGSIDPRVPASSDTSRSEASEGRRRRR